MYVYTYLSTYLPTYLSIYLSIYIYIYTSIYISISISIHIDIDIHKTPYLHFRHLLLRHQPRAVALVAAAQTSRSPRRHPVLR